MAFYRPAGEGRFDATGATAGPWSPALQHAGPPSALALRAVERLPSDGLRVARAAVDILRPVPVGPLEVRAEVIRPGRRVQLAQATLTTPGAEPALRLTAWRVAAAPAEVPETTPRAAPPPPLPPEATPARAEGWNVDGYLAEIEWRVTHGSFAAVGPERRGLARARRSSKGKP